MSRSNPSQGGAPRVEARRRLLHELFLSHRRGLLAYLTRKVGAIEAPDLLQETFLRVVRTDKLDAVVDPPAFLKQVAINLTRDFARRRIVEANHIRFGDYLIDPPSPEASAEDRADYERKTRLLRAAIATLPPRCRQVFELHIYHDLPLREVAQRMEISDRMARKHLALAFKTCRAALRHDDE